MKVRLTRKFADAINGIDLSKAHKGDTIDLSVHDATLLVAEGWAELAPDPDRADDQPPRSRKKKKR